MLNMCPPKPKYTHTWEVLLVTKYLDCLGKTKLLPLKFLSIKLAILFALSYPEQAFPRKRGSRWTTSNSFFYDFSTPWQTHRWHFAPLSFSYIKGTSSFLASKPDLLFCSFVKRHNPITAPTHSRWLHMALKNAGIETDIFKAHSDRGASTTEAVNSNVPLDYVRKMADSYCELK